MTRLGRRMFWPETRRSKSSPPLIGLVKDVDPALTAAQTPCTSGWPSDSFCGGHGLGAAARFGAPPSPWPRSGTVVSKGAAPIPKATIRLLVLIWQLLDRDT